MTGRQKRELLILIAIVAVAIIAGSLARTCSTDESPGAPRHSASSRVVATVNGSEIQSEDVDKYFRANLGMMDMKDEDIPANMRREVRQAALTQIIEETLLIEGAEDRGVSVNDEEVDSFIDAELRSEFASEEEFLASLEADIGFDLDDLRRMVRPWMIRKEMLELFAADTEITDEEIDAELKMYEEILRNHPGGDVPLPSREEVVANLRRQKAETEYVLWMDTLMADAEIEILDPELQASEPVEDAASQAPEEPGHQDQAERPDVDTPPDKTEE